MSREDVPTLKTKRFMFVIPITIIVLVVAIWMLNGGYSEIEPSIRLMIAIGAAIFSGVISYFLFPENEGKR